MILFQVTNPVDTAQGFLSGIRMPTIDTSAIAGGAMSFFSNIIIYAILGLILWLFVIRPMFIFKYQVHIYELTAGRGWKLIRDRGKFSKDKTTEQITFKLMKHKKAVVPGVDSELIMGVERGAKGLVNILKPNEVTYLPVPAFDDLHNPVFNLEAIDLGVYNSLLEDQLMIQSKYRKESMIKTLLPWIVLIIMCVFFYLSFKALIDNSANIAGAFNNAANTLSSAIKETAPYLQNLAGKVQPPPP